MEINHVVPHIWVAIFELAQVKWSTVSAVCKKWREEYFGPDTVWVSTNADSWLLGSDLKWPPWVRRARSWMVPEGDLTTSLRLLPSLVFWRVPVRHLQITCDPFVQGGDCLEPLSQLTGSLCTLDLTFVNSWVAPRSPVQGPVMDAVEQTVVTLAEAIAAGSLKRLTIRLRLSAPDLGAPVTDCLFPLMAQILPPCVDAPSFRGAEKARDFAFDSPAAAAVEQKQSGVLSDIDAYSEPWSFHAGWRPGPLGGFDLHLTDFGSLDAVTQYLGAHVRRLSITCTLARPLISFGDFGALRHISALSLTFTENYGQPRLPPFVSVSPHLTAFVLRVCGKSRLASAGSLSPLSFANGLESLRVYWPATTSSALPLALTKGGHLAQSLKVLEFDGGRGDCTRLIRAAAHSPNLESLRCVSTGGSVNSNAFIQFTQMTSIRRLLCPWYVYIFGDDGEDNLSALHRKLAKISPLFEEPRPTGCILCARCKTLPTSLLWACTSGNHLHASSVCCGFCCPVGSGDLSHFSAPDNRHVTRHVAVWLIPLFAWLVAMVLILKGYT